MFTVKVYHWLHSDSLPDEDARKAFTLYANVRRIAFVRKSMGVASDYERTKLDEAGMNEQITYCEALLEIPTTIQSGANMVSSYREVIVLLTGNVYVMNEAGKTVSSFSPGALPNCDPAS